MLRFDHISFAYHAGAPVLTDVSVDVEPGRLVAILGPNGSGKSTLVRLANGLALPSSGEVTVDGMSTADPATVRAVRRTVAAVFQHPDDQIVATSVEDDVAFGPENLGLQRDEIRERVDEAIAAVGLTGLERREPHLLSGGQKQRLAIAGALAMRPRYLVLDEPTSMLDPAGRAEVRSVVSDVLAAGRGVLWVTHDLAEVLSAERCIVLSAGEVAFDGSPAGLLDQVDRLAEWGLEVPPIVMLGQRLRAAGLDVPPGVGDPAAMVEALCR